MMDIELIKRVLVAASKFDNEHSLTWDEELNFYVKCNDTFWYASAHAEEIVTEEDVELYEKSCEDIRLLSLIHI